MAIACASSSVIFALPVHSENSLPSVVVTASRLEQPQSDALPHTTRLTAEDIRASAAPDLVTLLQREAGLQIGQLGGPGQPVSLFMRGQSPSHSLILIDGVPLSQQGFTAAPALEHLALSQIDSIEVVRGNASAIYGSSAIGGVIQIFTTKGTQQRTNSVAAEVGSFGTRLLNAGQSGGEHGLRYSVNVGSAQSDGVSTNNTRQYTNENPDRDGFRNNSARLFLAKEWARGQEFGIRAYGNDARFAFDGGGSGDPIDTAKGTNRQSAISLFSNNRISERWQSLVSLSNTSVNGFNTSDGVSNAYTIRDISRSTQLQWQNEHTLSANLRAMTGASYVQQSLDSYADYSGSISNANYSRNAQSVYAGVLASAGMHQWQANVRYDAVGGSGADTTGYLGYGYRLTPEVKLIGSVSTAFNAPTLAQRFDASSGNPDLKAETAQSMEVGLQYAKQGSLIRVTAFHTKTDNQFAPSPTNCSFNRCPTVNLKSSHNEGVELSASQKLGDTTVRASLTVQDPVDDSTGKTLFRRTKHFGAVSVLHTRERWQIGADWSFSGRHDDRHYSNTAPYSEDKIVPGYGKLSLIARHQWSKTLSVYARLDNAFDREYQTVYGYNQLPRGLYVGLNWQE